MQIVVNGEPRPLTGSTTIATLLAAMQLGSRKIAVEVNREIVPRSRHADFELKPDDKVEVVSAIGGG
jgi:thiamine biosynthesis protein ThiS